MTDTQIIPAEAEKDPALLRYEREVAELDQRGQWLPNWYLGKLAAIKGQREVLKAQYEIILRSYDNDQKQLEYRWGKEFEAIAFEDIAKQGSSKRSIDYLTGRAGYRKIDGKLVVLDEAKAIQWAKDNELPAAVKVVESLLKTPLNEQFEQDGIIPGGCDFVPGTDVFYIKTKAKLLTGG